MLGFVIEFCCKGPPLIGINEVDKISMRTSLTLEEQAARCSGLSTGYSVQIETILDLDPSLEIYSKVYLDLSFEAIWGVIIFVLSGSVSSLYIKTVYQDISFFFLFCFTSTVICTTAVGINVLTLPHTIPSRKIEW